MTIPINAQDIRTQAETLRKSKNVEQALPLYQQLWKGGSEHKWDGWGYAYCLRKVGQSLDALDVCRAVYDMDAEFKQNNSLYGWCIYDTEIKGRKADTIKEREFMKAAGAIAKLTTQEQYSPFEITVFRVLDYLGSKNQYPAQQILDWTNALDPVLLATDSQSYEDAEGVAREGASPREKFYMIRTKALFEAGDYSECIACCEAGLHEAEAGMLLHYNNDSWFYRRIALSKAQTGRRDEAIDDLGVILRRKKDWFIQRDLAELLYQAEKYDEAQKYAIDAALNAGDLEYKVSLFRLLALIFERKEELDLARQHIALALKIYSEQGWSTPRELTEDAQRLQVEPTSESSAELERTLKREWEKFKPRMRGTIKKYAADREFGFIVGEDNNDYFFKLKSVRRRDGEPTLGMKVSFVPEKGWDTKKNVESLTAINIRREDV